MLRCAHRSLRRLIHPRSVKVVKLDGKPVDEDTLNTVFVFFLCFMGVLGLACLVVCLDGFSLTTSFTATLACLSNTGPGLEAVGPMGTSPPSRPEQVGSLRRDAHWPSGNLPHPDPFAPLHLAEGLSAALLRRLL